MTTEGPRGPAVTTVQHEGRAQKRQQLQQQQRADDDVIPDRPASPMRAGLIGAGIAVAALAVVGVVIMLVGGF